MIWNFLSDKIFTAEDIHLELLRLRGLDSKSFLDNSTLQFHSPWLMHDMQGAVEIILKASKAGKKIFIHGDYDVDGVCATSILWDFLYRELKADVLPYIPDRFDEGYGLTPTSIAAMREKGAQLVITVDCGIRDQALIEENKDIDFVITDHHALPVDELGNAAPPQAARAVVHPKHPQAQYPNPEVCGALVAWKLICALNEKTGGSVNQEKYLDLVALATVCDVMPLVGENRLIVQKGLLQMRQTENAGLAALLKVAGVTADQLIDTYHLGFILGPRINAAGRIESAMTALRLLTTQGPASAETLAQRLNQLNVKRQQMNTQLQQLAKQQIAENDNELIYIVSGEAWPEGILGLVAGRLSEQLYRPVIALSMLDESGIAVGSARSIPEFNITAALQDVSEHLKRFGGHAQAAGLSIGLDKINIFREEISKIAREQLVNLPLQKKLNVDGYLQTSSLNQEAHERIAQLAPFGEGHELPRFAILDLILKTIKPLGKDGKHVKLWFSSSSGETVVGLGFNLAERAAEFSIGDRVDIVGSIQLNSWMGDTTVEMKLDDLRLSGSQV